MNLHQRQQYDLKNTDVKSRLRGLWRMTSGYHWHYLLANLSLGISALAKTSTYLLLSFFVDNYFPQTAGTPAIPLIALGFVGLALVEGSFTFLSGRLASFTAENVTRRLRNFLYDHIQRLSFTYHDKTQTGDLIERCSSDVDALRRFFSDQAIGAGRIVLLFIVNFVALLNLNVKLALFSIIVIPFIVISSIIFFKKVTKAYEAYQEQEAVLSTTLQENLSGVRVVKAFARQAFEMGKFEKENWEKFLRGRKLLRMHSLFWPISDVICSAQVIAGMIIGETMAIHGDITAGTYLAYIGLVVWIIYPMRNLGRMIVQMSTGVVSFTRVQDIIKEDREPLDEGQIDQVADLKGKLDFIKVGFSYDSEKPILKDISFSVNPGDSVALLGSTGSGKTSLVNLLPRFYESTSGEILLDGEPLTKYTREYLRSQIGIVEQEPFLFSRSIRENITYGVGRKVSEEEIIEAARSAAIHDVISSLPKGYDTLVGERGVTLSGGQKQRVAIARTILKNPRILILDDSTSAVDTETEAEIRLALENLMKARTTFIIAHRIQSIMNSDLILVMDEGKISQSGSHAQLVKSPGMYRKIFEIQTRIEDELEKEIADASV